MIERDNITGIILAGGKSSRMGTDKGFLKFQGSTFLERIINSMKPLVNDIIIVSNNSDYNEFKYKRVEDIIESSGPLAGLYTGLYHSKTQYNLVLSCDVPLLNSKVLNILLEGIDDVSEVIQLKSKDSTLPLIAIYQKHCLHRCLELLQNGERRLQVAVEGFTTKTILLDTSLEKYVKNINTMEQFKSMENGVAY
jgi:molybdopterin-guanine dinucleotide biosynthesis protein A